MGVSVKSNEESISNSYHFLEPTVEEVYVSNSISNWCHSQPIYKYKHSKTILYSIQYYTVGTNHECHPRTAIVQLMTRRYRKLKKSTHIREACTVYTILTLTIPTIHACCLLCVCVYVIPTDHVKFSGLAGDATLGTVDAGQTSVRPSPG